MATVLIIGNSTTYTIDDKMVTPRGYNFETKEQLSKERFNNFSHTLDRFKAIMDAPKKNKPKPRRATKESQGKDCPKVAVRRHSLE